MNDVENPLLPPADALEMGKSKAVGIDEDKGLKMKVNAYPCLLNDI